MSTVKNDLNAKSYYELLFAGNGIKEYWLLAKIIKRVFYWFCKKETTIFSINDDNNWFFDY